MQKGIGAAPFAIVAALILALAGGLWATQPAQAQNVGLGDVLLAVTNITDTDDFAAQDAQDVPFGPEGRVFEMAVADDDVNIHRLEATAAKDGNEFRGQIGRGTASWVELQASQIDGGTDATSYLIEITGEGSLSKSSTITSAACTANGEQECQFSVFTSGTPGGVTVKASIPVEASNVFTTGGTASEPEDLKGQWVGDAVSAVAITGAPSNTATAGAATFGIVSPARFLSGATPGLDLDTNNADAENVGFLFQLKDSAGQVAMNTTSGERDDVRVSVVTDAGLDLTLWVGLSVVATEDGDTSAYVDIRQEGDDDATTLSAGYPALVDDPAATTFVGGLIGVGLVAITGDDDAGKGSIGRIVVQLTGNTFEHPFAVAGDPDADMSSVGAPDSPINLGLGDDHDRLVTLRDANGTPVPLSAADAAKVINVAETDADGEADDEKDLWFDIGDAESDAPGVYPLTITANKTETDDVPNTSDLEDRSLDMVMGKGVDSDTRPADVGLHGFSVTIRTLAAIAAEEADEDHVVETQTADSDGNPLEAHVGSDIEALSVTGVTNAAGDDILSNGEVSVAAFELITITLTAIGSDDLAPANGSGVSGLSDSGFASSGNGGSGGATTNDAGEASLVYRADTETKALAFTTATGTGSAKLLVRIVDPDAPVVTGPATYSLASAASSTFHTWNGGDASSSEFENVANLVRVWWWSGSMWIGYTSNPNAPSATKTDFALSDGDFLYVVANGPVNITLD